MQHTIPTPASTTKNGITRTTWAVNDHALVRVEHQGGGDSYWVSRNIIEPAPHLYQFDEDGTWTLDWSSASDQTPGEALEFASRLGTAAQTALIFNRIQASN